MTDYTRLCYDHEGKWQHLADTNGRPVCGYAGNVSMEAPELPYRLCWDCYPELRPKAPVVQQPDTAAAWLADFDLCDTPDEASRLCDRAAPLIRSLLALQSAIPDSDAIGWVNNTLVYIAKIIEERDQLMRSLEQTLDERGGE